MLKSMSLPEVETRSPTPNTSPTELARSRSAAETPLKPSACDLSEAVTPVKPLAVHPTKPVENPIHRVPRYYAHLNLADSVLRRSPRVFAGLNEVPEHAEIKQSWNFFKTSRASIVMPCKSQESIFKPIAQ